MQTIKQVKYYERMQPVLPTDLYTPGGWSVRFEMDDGASFVFDHLDLSQDIFIIVPTGVKGSDV